MSSIGILSTATAKAVLGIREDSGNLNIGMHSTVARAEGQSTLRVWEEATCALLARIDLPAIDPAHPFTALVPIGGRTLDQVMVGYLDDQGNVLAGHRPPNCPAPEARVEPLPPWVETMLSGTVMSPIEVVSYTLLISNTGNLAAEAIIMDPVPPGMSVISQSLAADNGTQPVYSNGAIQLSGTVNARESVRLRFALAPFSLQPGDKITNTAEIAGSVLGTLTRQAVVLYAWQMWLPIVVK